MARKPKKARTFKVLACLHERAGIRTPDNLIKSQVLYHLSYLGIHHISYCQCKLRGQDLNLRPSGYEPDELPDCSTPRY